MRTWVGIVHRVSTGGTVMVKVETRVKHPIYGKFIRKESVYAVDDQIGCTVGDKVRIRESPPVSKTKTKRILEKVVI